MNKLVPIVFVVFVLGAGAYFVLNRSEGEAPTAIAPLITPVTTGSTVVDSPVGVIKTFNIEGGMYYFKPNVITVNKGDTVKIVFTNKEGMHDWVIDEFHARTKLIQTGQTDTISFVADKTGTFEFYCSVGSHRALGMKGSLVVQ